MCTLLTCFSRSSLKLLSQKEDLVQKGYFVQLQKQNNTPQACFLNNIKLLNNYSIITELMRYLGVLLDVYYTKTKQCGMHGFATACSHS